MNQQELPIFLVLVLCGLSVGNKKRNVSGECLVRVSFMWRVSCSCVMFECYVRTALCNLCCECLCSCVTFVQFWDLQFLFVQFCAITVAISVTCSCVMCVQFWELRFGFPQMSEFGGVEVRLGADTELSFFVPVCGSHCFDEDVRVRQC